MKRKERNQAPGHLDYLHLPGITVHFSMGNQENKIVIDASITQAIHPVVSNHSILEQGDISG